MTTPRSWTLEGCDRHRARHAAFGSIRWVKWSEFKVDNFLFPIQTPPAPYRWSRSRTPPPTPSALAAKFTDNWSGSVTFLYEPSEDGKIRSRWRRSMAARRLRWRRSIPWTTEDLGGINYTKLGDADLGVGPSGNKRAVAWMDDSDVWGRGRADRLLLLIRPVKMRKAPISAGAFFIPGGMSRWRGRMDIWTWKNFRASGP